MTDNLSTSAFHKKTDAPVDHQSGSWQHSSMNHVGKSTFNIEEVCMFNCGAESAVLPPWWAPAVSFQYYSWSSALCMESAGNRSNPDHLNKLTDGSRWVRHISWEQKLQYHCLCLCLWFSSCSSVVTLPKRLVLKQKRLPFSFFSHSYSRLEGPWADS